MMRSPHTHTAGEVGGPPNVAETGWGTMRRSRVREGVTRESQQVTVTGTTEGYPWGLMLGKSRGCYRKGEERKSSTAAPAWGPPFHLPSS